MRSTRRNNLTGLRPTKKRAYDRATATGRASTKAGVSMIVPTFLHMLNTVKLYHWKTTSFSTHKATDELYGELNDKLDNFVEVMLGKSELGGRAKLLNVHLVKLGVFSNNEAFKKQIESYKKFLMDLDKMLGEMHPDLLAIRDEILAAFNKVLYLLSLKD